MRRRESGERWERINFQDETEGRDTDDGETEGTRSPE